MFVSSSLSPSLSKDRRNIETFNLNLQSAKWTRSNVRFDSKQVQNIAVFKYICTLNRNINTGNIFVSFERIKFKKKSNKKFHVIFQCRISQESRLLTGRFNNSIEYQLHFSRNLFYSFLTSTIFRFIPLFIKKINSFHINLTKQD